MGRIKVEDTFPESAIYYNFESIKDSWFIQVPQEDRIGAGRIVCVSKETGQEVYDGTDGGE